jgi:multidrug efflux pump subunit AcrB
MKIKEKDLRTFSFSNFAVDNATSIFLLTFMILFFGIYSYQEMPKEQYPEASLPLIFVNTPYFGNSAPDIESLITRPIEKELQSLNGIKSIRSTSIQDFSIVTAEFVSEVDFDLAVRKVKDAVDLAKSELPSDLDNDPIVQEVNFSDLPIVTVNVSGDYPPATLKKYAEILEDEIEDVREVNEVEMKGDLENEVKINVDFLKMESMQVSFFDLQNAIASENITMSGGEIVNNDFRRAIRVKGEFENMEQIRNLIVKSENQRPVFLKDFATVEYGFKDRVSIARSDGFPVISLDVIKRRGENLLATSDYVKEAVLRVKPNLPDDLKVSFFNDQSIYTRNEVSNLENSIISGVILVILVLQFFLGLRNASFVGLAIPLSMLLGIMVLFISGVTINIVVLFSLILALGLLVDNAIVVVENIYRYMQNGYSGIEAAKYGAGEVAMPIIASTATTLAAFLPLAFWPGIMGSFMKYMPITLMIVLFSSLFVALVINPVFTSRMMKVDEKSEDPTVRKRKRRNVLIGAAVMIILAVIAHFVSPIQAPRNILAFATIISLLNYFVLRPGAFYFQNRFLPILENFYDKFIRSALRVPLAIFIGTFIFMFISFKLFEIRSPKVEFFPSADPVYVNAFVELPLGKDIEATNDLMKELEGKIQEAIQPYEAIVEAVLSQIGENTADPNAPPEPGASPNKARLTVSFIPANQRGELSTVDVMNDIRKAISGYPGVQIQVEPNADGPPTGKPINMEISGENLKELIPLSEQIIAFINSKDIAGIEDLKADVKLGKPELAINVDRAAARRYGVSTMDIANSIRTAVYGLEVSKFKDGEDEYPIYIRLDKKYRNNVSDLMNQRITFRNPANGQIAQVPISSVASVDYTSTYSSIQRKDLDRVITVASNIVEPYNANEVVAKIQEEMKNFDIPKGYSIEFTGEQQEQQENMEFLSMALLIALFMILIILVGQFNSIISPMIIMFSVIFSTIGVALGYALTGETISVIFTGVGVISLAGIVVNNAIVLVDYVNLLVKNKREELGLASMDEMNREDVRDAIINGGATRLRPVLLTAITTVLGLIPLAIGFNFNFFTLISELDPHLFIGGDNTAMWGPMAWTIIYGLVFATFLTLIVVPAMYWLAYRLKMRVKGLFS